jgi:hypothetical protein
MTIKKVNKINMINWINFITKENKEKKTEYKNIFNVYYPILYFKWIKRGDKLEKDKVNLLNNVSLLNIKYTNYILGMKKLDYEKDKGLNIFNVKKDKKFLDLIEETNIFIQSLDGLNNSVIKNERTKLIYKNILEEHIKNIESRKIVNKLTIPHFFFTSRYTEKSKPSQIKYWTSSVYSFHKGNKVHIHYLDYYTEKLIYSFFNINMIRIKNIWDEKFLLNGYKLLPNQDIIKDMNILINYTSIRNSRPIKNILNYSKTILNNPWLKEKIKFSGYIKELIKDRKTLKFGGFFAKKKIELDYNNRALLSKPLFKHTSYNLIIDLFLFNNKKYLFNKLDHILWRRTMYKYMYSMYINYINKINVTINRPRFFYINIIEPGIYNFYKRILKAYENLLILKSKIHLVYLCLFILKLEYFIGKNTPYLEYKNNILYFRNYINNNLLKNKLVSKSKEENIYINEKEKKNKQIIFNSIEGKKKEDSIKLIKNDMTENTWLFKFLTKFYLLNYKKRINVIKNNKIIDFLNSYKLNKSIIGSYNLRLNEAKEEGKFFNNKKERILKNINYLKYPKIINQYDNSKVLWDDLSFSLISILDQILNLRKNKWVLNKLTIHLFALVVNSCTISSNMFYYVNKLSIVEREFYMVNKDIIKTNNLDVNYNLGRNSINNYYVFKDSVKDKIKLKGDENNKYLDLYIWRSYFNNKRVNFTILDNLTELFKPYYRYMIFLFILESYKSLLSYIGYRNLILFYNKYFTKINSLKWFDMNKNVLYNYIMVKVLLDLFKYNYRSLIKMRPKFYYINKLRFYESKIRRLKFNTWLSAIKYLKRLRKTPRNFWKRYHKLVAFYYRRVIQHAELDTQRKIFTPFLIYFEDILYIIYNKPAIIRLWPLKKYFLSSVILVKRIMTTILMRQHKVSLGGYRKVIRKLISTFRALEIKKVYDYYISNNNKWPNNLINKLDISNFSHSLKYKSLEYYSKKEDRYHFLNVYFLKHYNLSDYISNIRNNYIQSFWYNLSKLKTGVRRQVVRSLKKSNISKYNYTYYWIKPLKNYIMQMRRNLDISGIKFRLGGRSGIKRSNMRRFKKIKYFGNLMGPVHSSMKIRKNVSLYNPQIIGHIKSNIDYSYGWGITKNGCLSLKIWISSLFSVDLRELLLHLVRIKNLYNELINRHYLIQNQLVYLNKNYYFESIIETVNEYNNKNKLLKYNSKKYLPKKWSFKNK